MMIYFAIVCVAFSAKASAEIKLSKFPCYKPKHRIARIVGGEEARDAPYHVGLMKHGGIVCGASIISENFLILAAHCVCNNQNNIVKPTQFQFYIGMKKLSDIKQSKDENQIPQEVFIKQIIVHSDYVCGKTENDIALLLVKTPIKFNQDVQPLCLSTVDPYPDEVGTVTGFGYLNENFSIGEKPDSLQKAIVPIWSNNECQTSYINLMKSNKISEKQLCAGGRNGGLDSCWSDSGGPLISQSGNLIGIVSTGVGCARKGLPGIYTRVSRYTKWIKNFVDDP